MKMKRYEYPVYEKDEKGRIIAIVCVGSYTIREGVKPLGFRYEKLVDTFEM